MNWLRGGLCACLLLANAFAAEPAAELRDVTVNGGVQDGKARLTIEGWLTTPAERTKVVFAAVVQDAVMVTREKVTQDLKITLDVIEGKPQELPLTIVGDAEIRQVTGGIRDWSVRQETNGTRTLVLRPPASEKVVTQLVVEVKAELRDPEFGRALQLLSVSPPQPALLSGYVRVDTQPELIATLENGVGLIPVEEKFLPEPLRRTETPGGAKPLAFRFQGEAYRVPIRVEFADPELRQVVIRDFQLVGDLAAQTASFKMTAKATVAAPKGGRIELLSGGVALTQLSSGAGWRLIFEDGRYYLVVEKPGEYPLEIAFNAAVRQMQRESGTWRGVDFRIAPGSVSPLRIRGLGSATQVELVQGGRPERKGDEFTAHVPADGDVKLSWKEGGPELEGKLFFAAEMLSQVTVSPGLMRQLALLQVRVMQGEVNALTLRLSGEGEVTRVQGEHVLAWNVVPGSSAKERLLKITFNQALKDQFSLQIQAQTPLGAFPASFEVLRLQPEGATRFAGFVRIANEGAVRLEVTRAQGMTQVSPEQFPESDLTRAVFRATGSQRFVYRFSGAEMALAIQADQIMPEISVSQVISYRLGENELSIDAELELDVREAPMRELWLRIPRGYAIARLTASGLNDYFVSDSDSSSQSELRLVYGAPVSGRQLVQLRLEQNKGLTNTTWELPPVEVSKAKSVRGHIGVAAESGYRLTPEKTQGLTEVATAYFPRKTVGLQSAFRLNEATWRASVRVERLPQSLQADVMHLFSIGEGIAYGSSVINYNISGAPVSSLRIEISEEYFNVEFSGKDVRAWQKTNGVYLVQLHAPVSGAYTLLASYERPFKAQGDTLNFTGARPLDPQSEQGHTLVISSYQFEVKPSEVSPGLLPLETGEVPAEYRLFFDAPILAAYRYTARPFNLRLTLSPLAQGDSLNQVVDRASITTRISKEGQVITDAKYFVKNRGNPQFRITLPPGADLWSASVNGASVVPVSETNSSLIPLPQRADPNSVLTVEVKLASRSKDPDRLRLSAPALAAPVMLAEWTLHPDTNQKLQYRSGTLTPASGIEDLSGFAQLRRVLQQSRDGEAWLLLLGGIFLWAIAFLVWSKTIDIASKKGLGASAAGGALFGGCLALLGCIALVVLADLAEGRRGSTSGSITLLAPVQQSGSRLEVELSNVGARAGTDLLLAKGWPALLGLGVWVYGLACLSTGKKRAAWLVGWILCAWAALRWPNGAPVFLGLVVAFLILQIGVSALRSIWCAGRERPPGSSADPAAPATALVLALLWLAQGTSVNAQEVADAKSQGPVLAESLTQEINVQEKFIRADATLHWNGRRGQLLPALFEPGVLTRVEYATNGFKLVRTPSEKGSMQQFLAERDANLEARLQYELHVDNKDGQTGFFLPTGPGLINQVTVRIANANVEVVSQEAVSINRRLEGSNTVAVLTLKPGTRPWIGWTPRSRDIRGEKSVFFADLTHLYAPAAGVVDGAHLVSIRPAQGEITELVLGVPRGATIIDVQGAVRGTNVAQSNQASAQGVNVSLWRFDPDAGKLRVSVSPPQSRVFTILVRSQVTTAPLPFEQGLGLLTVEGAAGQIGYVGVGAGLEVQLENVEAPALSPVNLEDFPGEVAAEMQARISGFAVRRAFRYTEPRATFTIKAAAVDPDVRVETQETVSLGEDRVLLAVNATATITRAGIFRVSFPMPEGFDVESVSSPALSHWTESRSNSVRIITMHLKGKTEGQQQFAVTLTGPGARATNHWLVPQFILREATKQRGTLVLAPEQGMRLQAGDRESLTQLDPQKSGIPQKGVLAFRILQTPWRLSLAIEQVDPWIQVTSLQHVTLREAQVKIAANLQYQIDNTGVKQFRVLLPTNAESVSISGDQISDSVATTALSTNGLRIWEVKLHRRVIGSYRLQVNYQMILPQGVADVRLRGIEAADVNTQRGYLSIQSSGRLQARPETLPETLQPTEWQSVPKSLLQDLRAESANLAYRLVEPAFELVLRLDRHEPAKMLPARVNSIGFNSVVADDGAMLTQARLEIMPGDKRLLQVTLPPGGNFWFAFVNQNGVWPWRDREKILIPLEQQSRGSQPITVEVFYTAPAGKASNRSLDLDFAAPKFDLPLENITWRVILSDKWKVSKWSGSLQLEAQVTSGQWSRVDSVSYLQSEANVQQQRTREAEQLLAVGNNALQQGDPQQARRAFQSAFGLSTHDAAFNEDARVQLQNVKLQQALIGLNYRNALNAGEAAPTGKVAAIKGREGINYTQQDVKQILEGNTAEDNAALVRVAERIVQQQDAAVSSPAAIRASIPEQGRVLTFKRPVAVTPGEDLRIKMRALGTGAAPVVSRLVTVMLIAIGAGLFSLAGWRLASRRVSA